ncbi:MAG: SagB/ThcOx family dehydrogenase [Candidatus Sumerlaeaceae bacterium]|nr:SagB/ThcOx family dehydrogenase [Candidatus Sumerlaeaceae bacterium]
MISKLAPMAALYHENSSICRDTLSQDLESIQAFLGDDELIRQAMTGHKTYPIEHRVPLGSSGRLREPKTSLFDALRSRRTIRRFSEASLSLDELKMLLTASFGQTGTLQHPSDPDLTQPLRAYPSGGALYPVEIYLANHRVDGLRAGIHHLNVVDNCLELVTEDAGRVEAAGQAILAGESDSKPALTFIFTILWKHVLTKYGERGYRIALLETGHVVQNLLLVAASMKLAALPIAGFDDRRIGTALDLKFGVEDVVYVAAVGKG